MRTRQHFTRALTLLLTFWLISSPTSQAQKPARKAKEQETPLLAKHAEPARKFIDNSYPKALKSLLSAGKKLKKRDRQHFSAWFGDLLAPKERAKADADFDLAKAPKSTKLKAIAKKWLKCAEGAKKAGLRASALWEARRALGLSPTLAKAAKLLDYKVCKDKIFRHPRHAQLEEDKTYTSYGWLDSKLAASKKRKKGQVPEGEEWIDADKADALHEAWGQARKLEYTFVSISTNLPIEVASAIGRKVDQHLETWRARFAGHKDFQEPQWPLKINLTHTRAEFNAVDKALGFGEPGTPFGIYRPHKKEAIVCHETCKESHEGTLGIVLHEATHAFLYQAFPGGSQTPQIPFGWMFEAAAASVYYFNGSNPATLSLIPKLKAKADKYGEHFAKPLAKVTSGEDEIARLNRIKDYNTSVGDLQAYIAGAAFVSWGLSQIEWREATVNWIVATQRFKAKTGDFEKTVGDSKPISKAIGDWAKRQGAK